MDGKIIKLEKEHHQGKKQSGRQWEKGCLQKKKGLCRAGFYKQKAIRGKEEEDYPSNAFISGQDLVINLGNFLFEYNHLRKHGGLNYETSFDKLIKVTELLS